MGEVYKATDTRLERTVAIKVLPAHVASDPERKARFEREAKTVAALSHPHICPVFDVGREGETDFLVMEYLEGETLADRLSKGALPLDQALRYAIEIADALDKAHRQGVTHRDLKPANSSTGAGQGRPCRSEPQQLVQHSLALRIALEEQGVQLARVEENAFAEAALVHGDAFQFAFRQIVAALRAPHEVELLEALALLNGLALGPLALALVARHTSRFEHLLLVPGKPLVFARAFRLHGHLHWIESESSRRLEGLSTPSEQRHGGGRPHQCDSRCKRHTYG